MVNVPFLCLVAQILLIGVFGGMLPDYLRLLPLSKYSKLQQQGLLPQFDCPCDDLSLCNNVQTTHSKELFGFSGDLTNVSQYNWTYLTTLAWPPSTQDNPSLLCEAHNNSVRLIAACPGDYPLTNNKTTRMIWIESLYNQVKSLYLDGVTFDYEQAIALNSNDSLYYTQLVNDTTNYFHSKMAGSQISVCVPWAPYNIDGRNYDWVTLSQVSDLLYIMFYDTQSQIYDRQCIASANSPWGNGNHGLSEYIALGIDRSKLILGVPWYGYDYPCQMDEMESIESKYCPIDYVPFRGVNCTDAAGREMAYSYVMQIIDEKLNVTQIKWDKNTQSPFFNYKENGTSSQVHQIWFDDPVSLSKKYSMAKSYNIRGIGPFVFNYVVKAQATPIEQKRAQEMWSAFDAFFV